MRGATKPTILPRIAQYPYEPLGGSQSKWRGYLTWKRVAIGATLLVLLFWVASPGRSNRSMTDDVPTPDYEEYNSRPSPPEELVDTYNPPSKPAPAVPKPLPGSDADANSTPTKPLSYATDPDPAGTTHCSSAHPGKPIVQWALMIDAGSTGSRIHAYKFNNCGPSPVYEYEVFKMTRPGLSSFAGKPRDAAQSLDELFDEAVRVIPETLRKCTPVAVKATAGLRLLGHEQSEEILVAIKERITEKYPFKLVDKDGVVIMEGREEGVYAWITANYLLDTIRTASKNPPYAVLDLGGASTQIVFEPIFDDKQTTLEDGEHKYDLQFAGKDHVLYQHSYLGYGLMRARASVHRLVEFMASYGEDFAEGHEIANPCLSRGTRRTIEVDIGRGPNTIKRNYTMVGVDVGGFEACNRVMELVIAKDAICHVKPCSFNGVYQPSLMQTFTSGPILLLSYFYDRLHPLMPSKNRLTIADIATTAERVCSGRTVWEEHWGNDEDALFELEDRPEYCLDLTFQHALLRLGYEFEDKREVRIEKKVSDTELGWCLGATISMLDGHLECRQ